MRRHCAIASVVFMLCSGLALSFCEEKTDDKAKNDNDALIVAAGCKPNPALDKLSHEEYLSALSKLNAVFLLKGLDARKAVEYGIAHKKDKSGDLMSQWDKAGSKWANEVVFPRPPVALFVMRGWSKSKRFEDIDWKEVEEKEPSHYLPVMSLLSRRSGRKDELDDLTLVMETENGKHYQASSKPIELSHHVEASRTELWFTGQYLSCFDLFDTDGTARIGPDDKSVSFIVITAQTERKIKFLLSDWGIDSLKKKR
jgi:hypothetical protein